MVTGNTSRAAREARTQLPEIAGRAFTRAVEIVPLNRIVEQVDVDAVLQRVDVDLVLRRVSMQSVIDRIDLDAVLERIDLTQVVERIDLNAVLARLDLDTLVERTDLGAVIAQSTGGMASNAVDLVRRQGVGLDELVANFAARIWQRAFRDSPPGPPLLAGEQGAAR